MSEYYKIVFYFTKYEYFFNLKEIEGGNLNSKERKLLFDNFYAPNSLNISSSKTSMCLEIQVQREHFKFLPDEEWLPQISCD